MSPETISIKVSTPVFCPQCKAYVGLSAPACPNPYCGWQRPPGTSLPQPGQASWQTCLPGRVVGRPVAAGDLLLCAWGERTGRGGVVALERATGQLRWDFEVPYGLEAGIALNEEHLFFCGRVGLLPGERGWLYCLRLEDGKPAWAQPRPTSGACYAAPILQEVRVYTGGDGGRVDCYDWRAGITGQVRGWPAVTGPGRQWLYLCPSGLLAVTGGGEVHLLDPLTGRACWAAPLTLGENVRAAPVQQGEMLYIVTDAGARLALDVRRRQVNPLGQALVRVIAPPALSGGKLYIGTQKRSLLVVDAYDGSERWSQELARSVSAGLLAEQGFVVTAVNQTGLVAFDEAQKCEVWSFQAPTGAVLFSDLLLHDGTIYFGTDKGQVYALPWHLGKYAWAADWLGRHGDRHGAAALYAAAGDCIDCDPKARRQHYDRAIQIWKKIGDCENAARLHETMLDEPPEEIAREYEQAGTHNSVVQSDPQHAARLLFKAADWYMEADDDASAQRCWQRAKRVARAPLLQIQKVVFPTEWEAGEQQQVVLDLKNTADITVSKIRVRLAGSSIACRVKVEMSCLAPGATAEIESPLLPRCPGELAVDVLYTDTIGREWSANRKYPMQVKPSTTWLEVDGDAAALLLYEKELPGKVRVRGDVGLIKVKSERPQDAAPALPPAIWPAPEPGFATDAVEVLRATLAEDEYTVPAGHWAFFLADDKMLGKVEPGRYLRTGIFPGSHHPVWQVVQFREANMRLAFRLGPYPCSDTPSVGIEFGFTLAFDPQKAFQLWQQAAQGRQCLSAQELQTWLESKVGGIVQAWLHTRSRAQLASGFAQRDGLLLELETQLSETFYHHGLRAEGQSWGLRFSIPCPHCGQGVDVSWKFCNTCKNEM